MLESYTQRRPRQTTGRRRFLLSLSAAALAAALSASAALLAPGAARAQLSRVPQVAVLDLNGPAEPRAVGGAAGEIWARQATDALVVEMQRTGRFDVIPRETVVRQIQDLGLAQPLDSIAQLKLGQALGADYVATGAVTRLSVEKDGRAARASLAVVLTDSQTGEAANGAYTVGTARAGGTTAEKSALSTGEAEQAMTLHALSNAAFEAVRTINNYTLPQATVLSTIGGQGETVLLNGGSRSGIRAGQEFMILRGGDRVGRVRITQVDSQSAQASVVDPGKGIRPEDRARAVFSFADGLGR